MKKSKRHEDGRLAAKATVEETLAARVSPYGVFAEGAAVSQALKELMRATPGWARLAPDMKEALDMIQYKVMRIVNGDPSIPDHWHDIGGYAGLVENRLKGGPKQ